MEKTSKLHWVFCILIMLSIPLVVGGCAGPEEESINTTTVIPKVEVEQWNVNPNKQITHLTSGIIDTNDLIAVRFKEEQVNEKDLNKPEINIDIFSFNPKLKGQVFWADRRTLVFQPEQPLTKAHYFGKLNLQTLFPDLKNVTPKEETFSFEYLGQAVANLVGDFRLMDDENKSKLIFEGRIKFLETCELDSVSKALSLSDNGQDRQLTVTTEDNLTFNFKSDMIFRTSVNKDIVVRVMKEALNLTEDYEKNYLLSALNSFQIVRVEEEKDQNSSSIRVVFSDELQPGKNYSGYVVVTPSMDLTVDTTGKSLLLRGDFKPGQKYKLKILSGVASRLGEELITTEDYDLDIQITDIRPQVEFANSGVFLTAVKDKRIAFRTMNLERVHLKIKKVAEDNLISFFEENSVRANSNNTNNYNTYNFKRVGEIIDSRILELGQERNKWIQSEIDLSKVIEDGISNLYIVQLEFEEQDALYFPEESSWWIREYVWDVGQKVKHLILSNIGITAKKAEDTTHVFVSDVISTEPLPYATVYLKDEYGQVLSQANTNAEGMCELKKGGEYIEVRYRDQYSILKFQETESNMNLFDVGGVDNSSGIQAFIYTDRGVYRPGDTIYLSVIARNEEHTFPENHPITLKILNPKGKLAFEYTQREAKDGFYSFHYTTKETDLTGDWQAKLSIGGTVLTQTLKIEEIVPYRINVDINSAKDQLSLDDSKVEFDITSNYLFGTPASGLDVITDIFVEPYLIKFKQFNNFTFNNESIDFSLITVNDMEGELDEEGILNYTWYLPKIMNVPSALQVRINSRVLEEGGRPVPAGKIIPINIFDRFVGIQKPEEDYIEIGNEINFNIVLVSKDGEYVPDKELKYRIYGMRRYWWWEYDDQTSFRRHYKTASETQLIETGMLLSKEGCVTLNYNINDYGEMLIEVEDVEGGHSVGYFFRSYWWGDSDSTRSADIMNIRTDKDTYAPGDIAKVLVKSPAIGKALVTVEKSGQILEKRWQEITATNTEIEIPIKENYVPTVYATVTVFQPYEKIINDMPVRMYGIVPLNVIKPDTHLEFTLETPEMIEPNQKFEVKIKSVKPAQFTIAVVDEGLLDITKFNTPDPWEFFFLKERLLTRTYDTYSDIIGLNWGYMHHLFSVGGEVLLETMGMDEYAAKQIQNVKAKRFKATALFAGPIQTDQSGEARVSFTMPEYIGKVRVMVIGAAGESYGSCEKGIIVKSPLIVMPSLPRVLGPEDQISVPVTVFGTEDNIGEVRVKVEATGPVRIVGESERTLDFSKKQTQLLSYTLVAEPDIGVARIKFTASSANHLAEKEIEIGVRAYNPYIYLSSEQVVGKGQTITLQVPEMGLKNSTTAQVNIAMRKNLNLNHRMDWLIRYPYGCIEQTTSSVFPQLYLKEIFVFDQEERQKIDQNINAAIERLRNFQLPNGSFSYWPNSSTTSTWGTNYAGHFLIEVQKKGYYVSQEMMDGWIRYQKSKSRDNSDDYLTHAYRLYLLALAGQPELSAMNYLRESKLMQMPITAKYYLAGAYKLIGYEENAVNIMNNLGIKVYDYDESDLTFGSKLRDKAIILEVLTLMKYYENGLQLYNEISECLSSEEWYSTQTTAYSLLGLSKYINSFDSNKEVTGKVILANGEKIDFISNKTSTLIPIRESFGQKIQVLNTSEESFFVTLEWEGIPLKDGIYDESNNLGLEVEWLDNNGNLINPTELVQGTTFWGHFRVTKQYSKSISEIALVQILPSGWEIENTRLLGGELPRWMRGNFNLDQEEYLDIRDDRVMWFFDLDRYEDYYDFIVKLNAVTVGEFYLPPTMVEAMYNNNYKATIAGKRVRVIER